jgi:hypothetical protein
MGVDVGAHLDLLDLDDLLVLARLGRLFLVGVFQLAEIEDLADWRIGIGGNLDEIEAGFLGCEQRVVDRDISEIVAVGRDELDAGDTYVLVGARAFLGGRRRFERSANGRFSLAVDDTTPPKRNRNAYFGWAKRVSIAQCGRIITRRCNAGLIHSDRC